MMTSPLRRTPDKRLRTPQPNAGVTAAYERLLRQMVRQMGQDYLSEVRAAYRQVRPGRIGDGIVSGSVAVAARVLERLREKWAAFFNGESRGVASEFVRKSSGYQGRAFRRLLRRYSQLAGRTPGQPAQGWRERAVGGPSLPILGPSPTPEEEQEALEALREHEATRALRNVGAKQEGGWIGWENEHLGPLPSLPSGRTPEGQVRVRTIEEAAVEQNVALIQSIPQQFHDRVARDVYEALSNGWPMDELEQKLRHSYGLTRKRARFIAKDQNRAITARLNVAQALEAWGEDAEAEWGHVKGGETHPRPSHVAADGKRFRLSEGCWIDGEYILPGQKIGCKCGFTIPIPGFPSG